MKTTLLLTLLSYSVIGLFSATSNAANNTEVLRINEFPVAQTSYLNEPMRYEITDILKAGYGVTKSAVRLAIGSPHFSEFNSNQWNYLISLREPHTANYIDCQLQLYFDKDVVKRIYWKDKTCPNLINASLNSNKPLL